MKADAPVYRALPTVRDWILAVGALAILGFEGRSSHACSHHIMNQHWPVRPWRALLTAEAPMFPVVANVLKDIVVRLLKRLQIRFSDRPVRPFNAPRTAVVRTFLLDAYVCLDLLEALKKFLHRLIMQQLASLYLLPSTAEVLQTQPNGFVMQDTVDF